MLSWLKKLSSIAGDAGRGAMYDSVRGGVRIALKLRRAEERFIP